MRRGWCTRRGGAEIGRWYGIWLVESDNGGIGDDVCENFVRVESDGAIGCKGIAGNTAVRIRVLAVNNQILIEMFTHAELV